MNVHIRITNYCNLQCKECWGINKRNTIHMVPDMFIKALKYIAPITDNDKINITGGEPTASPYFKDINEILHQTVAFRTVSTNAYNLNLDLVNNLLRFDRIQVPLDGSNSLKFNKFRCGTIDYLSRISDVVSLIKVKKYSGIIKFGTVIVDDLLDLENIYGIINSYGLKRVEWRIYPLLKKNEKYSGIKLNDKLLQIKNNCDKNEIQFSIFTPENRNDKYIFVNPNGIISTIKNNVEITIGQL